jgi:hypothetical protein
VTLDDPGPQFNTEGDVVSLALGGSDATNGSLTYSAAGLPPGLAIDPTSGDLSGTLAPGSAGSYQVSVTATDNTYSNTLTIDWEVAAAVTLTDPGPQFSSEGQQVSLALTGADATGGSLTWTATGLPPGLEINAQNGAITGQPQAGSAGFYEVSVTATDGTYSATAPLDWLVETPITVSNPGDQGNLTGLPLQLQIQASAGAGNDTALDYQATGLPDGLAIDPTTGLISGVPSTDAATDSPYLVTLTVTGGGAQGQSSFAWAIVAPGKVPTGLVDFSSIAGQTNSEGDAVTLPLDATDYGAVPLAYTVVGLPDGLTINPQTGAITGSVAEGAAADGPYLVTVTASDWPFQASQRFLWTITTPVTLTVAPVEVSTEGEAVALFPQAGDTDGRTLTFTALGLPPGLSVNPQTGELYGTLAAGDAANGPFDISLTATDGLASATAEVVWDVVAETPEPANDPVTLTNPGAQCNSEGDSVAVALQDSDSTGAALTFDAFGLPAGLSIDPSTGDISGVIAPGAAAGSPYEVTVSASETADPANNASVVFWWDVNTPVTITTPADQTNTEGDNVSVQVTAADTNGDGLSYAALGLPDGLSIDEDTGVISGKLAPGSGGTYDVTVTATTADGKAAASTSFAWTVASAITVADPGWQLSSEGGTAALPMAATDATGGQLSYSALGLPDGLSINTNTGVISGTLAPGTASDVSYAVTVTASDGTYSGAVTFLWQVVSVDSALVGSPVPVTATAGRTFIGTVATFTDAPNPTATATDFTALIQWGDGEVDYGTVSANSSGGFDVTARHNYANAGTYAVQVTIMDPDGGAAPVTTTATVAAPPPAPKADPDASLLGQAWQAAEAWALGGLLTLALPGAPAAPNLQPLRFRQDGATWVLNAAANPADTSRFVNTTQVEGGLLRDVLPQLLRTQLLPQLLQATPQQIADFVRGLNPDQRLTLNYAVSLELAQLEKQLATRGALTGAAAEQARAELAILQALYSELVHAAKGADYGLHAQNATGLAQALAQLHANPDAVLSLTGPGAQGSDRGTPAQRLALLADTDYATFRARELAAIDARYQPPAGEKLSAQQTATLAEQRARAVADLPTAEQYYTARAQLTQAVEFAAATGQPLEKVLEESFWWRKPSMRTYPGPQGRPGRVWDPGQENPYYLAVRFLFQRYLQGASVQTPLDWADDRYTQATLGWNYLPGWQQLSASDKALFADALTPQDRMALIGSLAQVAQVALARGDQQTAQAATDMARYLDERFQGQLAANEKNPLLQSILHPEGEGKDKETVVLGLKGGAALQALPKPLRLLAEEAVARDLVQHIRTHPFKLKYEPASPWWLGGSWMDRFVIYSFDFLSPFYRTTARLGAWSWLDGGLDQSQGLDAVLGAMDNDFRGDVRAGQLRYDAKSILWDAFWTAVLVLPVGAGSGARGVITGGRWVTLWGPLAGRQALSAGRYALVLEASMAASAAAMATVDSSNLDPKTKQVVRFWAGLAAGLYTAYRLDRALPRIGSIIGETSAQLTAAKEALEAVKAKLAQGATAELEQTRSQLQQVIEQLTQKKAKLAATVPGSNLDKLEQAEEAARRQVAALAQKAAAPGLAPSQQAELAAQLQAVTKAWRQAEAALQKAYDAIDAAAVRLGINCFPPETLVATETGLRRIGEIEPGERVWGFDFQRGEWRLCAVEARHDAFFTGPLVTLESDAGEVTATALHPFWVVAGPDLENRPAPRHIDADADRGGSLAGRWVNSDDLREGNVLFLRGAGLVTLRRVRQQQEWMTPVCNLTVQGLHTFAVGELQALVHNISGTGANDLIQEVTGKRLPGSTMAAEVARAVDAGDAPLVKLLLKGYKVPERDIDRLAARLFEAAGVTPRNTILGWKWATDAVMRNLYRMNKYLLATEHLLSGYVRTDRSSLTFFRQFIV